MICHQHTSDCPTTYSAPAVPTGKGAGEGTGEGAREDAGAASGTLEFRLLGIVQMLVEGVPVDLGPRRQRLVLAILALEANRLVPVDRLVALSWPTDPPRTAVHAVRVSVSQLRSILTRVGAARYGVELAGTGSSYVLRTQHTRVDTHRFRALVQQTRGCPADERKAALLRNALDLWQGPALTDIGPAQTREGLARGLETARLVAMEDLIETELALGRHRQVLGELTELVEAHPWRERFAAQLMVALYRSGQASAALEVFQRIRARLGDELGIDPSAELRRLELSILRGDMALTPPRLTSPLIPAPVTVCLPGPARNHAASIRIRPPRRPTDCKLAGGR